jgi:uncharacterized protein
VIRAVIDTNALVSGLLSPRGNEALILLAVHQGFVRPCISTEMLEEYAEVLARPKFAFSPDEIAAVIAMLRDKGELIVRCAVTAQADYLVTGNKRHFPPEACGPVRVVNAAEILDWITLEI